MTLLHISSVPGPGVFRIKRYGEHHVPGYYIWGSLVPPCPFCGVASVLVVFSNSVGRFASGERGIQLHFGDVLIECADCRASTTLIDRIGEDDLSQVIAVAKEQSRKVVKRRRKP